MSTPNIPGMESWIQERTAKVLDNWLARLEHLANKVVVNFGKSGSYTDDWGVEQNYNSSDKKKGKAFKMSTQFVLKLSMIQLKLITGAISPDGTIAEMQSLSEEIDKFFDD